MLDLLTTSMPALADKDGQGKDISASGHHKENVKAYDAWFKRDRSTCYTMLCCMYDDLLWEFERFPTTKDMWAEPKIRFNRTSATRLRTLQLKWMQYTIDSSYGIFKHLQAMSAMVQDRKAVGQHVSEGNRYWMWLGLFLMRMNVGGVLKSLWHVMKTFKRWLVSKKGMGT